MYVGLAYNPITQSSLTSLLIFCRVLQAPPPLILEAGPLDTSDREAVMRFAGECVREGERERKKVESRAELLRQLQEAEATEAKENLKVVH